MTDTRTVNDVPAVVGDYCADCGEIVLDRAQADRYAAALRVITAKGTASNIVPTTPRHPIRAK
jgi:hypothetical protein